jgi:hypothetical protein
MIFYSLLIKRLLQDNPLILFTYLLISLAKEDDIGIKKRSRFGYFWALAPLAPIIHYVTEKNGILFPVEKTPLPVRQDCFASVVISPLRFSQSIYFGRPI